MRPKSVARQIKGKIHTHLKKDQKTLLISYSYTIAGHGPVRDHLALIKLTDESKLPKVWCKY